ncbi:hypothetical protein C1T31_11445 [Hanstruepera neustonica]|uniref:DUF4421 domain-containing protein n=1 Tax=Hanstruepera neustonica TaxID=1445657 RepID=A0A2K1DWM1_9FLAO|nr:DUF4421 family protein [Hanstruepera neustonica]PNQ72403.1 hypothetical protein C1T31_11445 [Hanstruepera neustonica]
MIQRFLVLVAFLVLSVSAQSQTEQKRDSLNLFKIIDSLFIDHDLSNYSARLFSNYKVKQFRILNDGNRSRYIPNNRFGVGFGVANSKLLIDIAFNIKSGKKETTDRFDAQGSLILGKHNYISFYLQTYKGFNIRNNFDEPNIFRHDIKSSTVGFNYLYTFSEIEFSLALLKAGMPKRDRKVQITGGIGTFAVFDTFSADGDILTENGVLYFNEEAEIEKYSGRAVGILGGFLSQYVISDNFIATCNLMPGVALMNKKVRLDDGSYRPSNPMLYKLDFSFALGYSINRYYINLIYGTGIYATNLDFGNEYLFNHSMAKFAIGYKLKVKK